MKHSLLAIPVALLAACSGAGPEKKGPFVAQGNGVSVTAEEFKARLDEQSPFIRSRFTTLDRKKEFLDNLIRFEVLAREAQRQGLDKDPDVQLTLKKVMVQRLVQKSFGDPQDAVAKVPEADVKDYYEKHRDEFVKPLRLRVYQIVVKAPASGPERSRKQAEARKVLAHLQAEEKKNAFAFPAIAREKTEDPATKATGGDLGFKSREELEKASGKAVADAAFALKDNQTSGLVESPDGFHILRAAGRQEAVDRSLEQVKVQIAQKLHREKASRDFDEFVKKLRDDAAVKVDDAELEKVQVAAAPQGAPAMPPGMMLGPPAGPHPPMRPPGAPGVAPGPAPAPPASPAPKK
jgi:peptidyl-prolyl cis-trans isomerase C